jgi:hypothetical protein
MYVIVKNGKKQTTKFQTYEQARQTVRKRIRKLTKGATRFSGQPVNWLRDFGYTIKAV